jgi:hypothetical protein
MEELEQEYKAHITHTNTYLQAVYSEKFQKIAMVRYTTCKDNSHCYAGTSENGGTSNAQNESEPQTLCKFVGRCAADSLRVLPAVRENQCD